MQIPKEIVRKELIFHSIRREDFSGFILWTENHCVIIPHLSHTANSLPYAKHFDLVLDQMIKWSIPTVDMLRLEWG